MSTQVRVHLWFEHDLAIRAQMMATQISRQVKGSKAEYDFVDSQPNYWHMSNTRNTIETF